MFLLLDVGRCVVIYLRGFKGRRARGVGFTELRVEINVDFKLIFLKIVSVFLKFIGSVGNTCLELFSGLYIFYFVCES